MKKMIVGFSLLLCIVQLKASQRTLTSGTQTGSRNDDHESDDESSLSSLSQAYQTARTSPTLQHPTVSQGTQTDDLLTTPGNPVPSAPPEELLQQQSPEYLEEEPEKTEYEKNLVLLQDASKKVDQYTFGVHDKIAIPALAVLSLLYLDNRKILNNMLLSGKALGALAVLGGIGLADMIAIRKNYFTSEFLPVAITSGGASLAAFFTKNRTHFGQDFYPFAFGATLGTTLYYCVQAGKILSAKSTLTPDQTRALKN